MPLGDLEDEELAKVLVVAQDQVVIENLRRELPPEGSFRVAVAEVLELLRERAVHVVDCGHAEELGKNDSHQAGFFVAIEHVVALGDESAQR